MHASLGWSPQSKQRTKKTADQESSENKNNAVDDVDPVVLCEAAGFDQSVMLSRQTSSAISSERSNDSGDANKPQKVARYEMRVEVNNSSVPW